MAWSTNFKNGLARRSLTLGYTVAGIAIFGPGAAADTPGGGAGLSTAGRPKPSSGTWLRGIDPLSVQFSTEALDLRTCTYSGGEWRFDYVWESAADRSAFYDGFTRGTPCHIRAILDFDQPADGEILRLGVVADITEVGRRITVRCWDLLSVLHPRIVKDTWPVLFGGLDGTDTLIAGTAYVADDATIYVTNGSAANFTREDGATYYLVQITPDSGDPFYVKFTTAATVPSPDELQGATSGQFGTTTGNASIGNLVQPAALVEGTPFEIARKVLASTGDPAYNGSDDVLPESWGYGLDADHIDDSDMTVWETVVAPGSGSHAWSWIATTGDENGLGTHIARMALGGMWLVNRQGQITARALQDLWGTPQETGDTLTDTDIIGIGASLAPRDSSQPFEYVQVNYSYYSSGAVTSSADPRATNATWPLDRTVQADLTSVIYTNGSAQITNYNGRMKPWYTQIPERIRVRMAGLKHMKYCVGDVVKVTSTALRGFLLNTEDGPSAQPYMIAAIRWGLPEPWVDLDLVLTPEDSTDERA